MKFVLTSSSPVHLNKDCRKDFIKVICLTTLCFIYNILVVYCNNKIIRVKTLKAIKFLIILLCILLLNFNIPSLFNRVSASEISKNSEPSTKYKHLSSDNPVFELFRNELNDDPVRMSKALEIANELVGKTKDLIQDAGYTDEIQFPTRRLDLFYGVLRYEFMATFPKNGVEQVAEGLLSVPLLIDCDTSCALFMIAGHEFKWPLTVMACIGRNENESSHTFLKWTVTDGSVLYYETTCGLTMKDYHEISAYNEMYKEIIEISPEQFFANFNLIAADQQIYDSNLPGRIMLYTKAIENGATLLPKRSQFYNRGNAYLALGNNTEAILDYSKAMETGPRSSSMYYNRAIAFLNIDEQTKGLQDLIMAIQLDPEHENARYNRSVLYFQKKQYAMALSDAVWLCRKYPGDKDYEELCREIKRVLSYSTQK